MSPPDGGWPVEGALAFVCPRYGPQVLGGAESVVRELAERMAPRGHAVEVLTTCAVDHYTWANALPEGETTERGVRVRRFPIQQGPGGDERVLLGYRISGGEPTTLEEQRRWMALGFRCEGLVRHLAEHHRRYHTVVLIPYLFWTTYAGAQVAPRKNVIHPCLHDEPEARLEIFRPLFREARGVIFNSPPEGELAARILDLPALRKVCGVGVEPPREHDAARFRARYGVTGPFLLYAGRREWGKGYTALLESFERFAARDERGIKLVVMGRGDVPTPERLGERVVDLGFVAEQDKHDAMAAALAVWQPSLRESFSIVLMEAWLAGTPVLVDPRGAVTTHQTLEARGGLLVRDDLDLEVAVELLLERPALRARMAESGRRHVLAHHTWERVLERYVETIGLWAEADALADPPLPRGR